jgi:VWFA-related protein
MRLKSAAVTIVLLAAAVRALVAGSAQEADKHVFVTALDREGKPIVGMSVEHFAVRESGRERKVLQVEPLRTPMHAAVLVDTSIAGGSPDETFRSAVIGFVERLAISNHVAVYSFGDRAARVADFTQDATALRAATRAAFGWSHDRSLLIDGIDLALRDFEKAEPLRPVMIAITSESPEASGKTAGGVLKRLITQSVAFHAISLASATGSGQAQGVTSNIPEKSRRLGGLIAAGEGDRERNQMLEQGTSLTGGGRQRVASILAIGSALARTANELANGYKITFARPGSARMEDLQVGVLIEGITLRATAAPFGTR